MQQVFVINDVPSKTVAGFICLHNLVEMGLHNHFQVFRLLVPNCSWRTVYISIYKSRWSPYIIWGSRKLGCVFFFTKHSCDEYLKRLDSGGRGGWIELYKLISKNILKEAKTSTHLLKPCVVSKVQPQLYWVPSHKRFVFFCRIFLFSFNLLYPTGIYYYTKN